MEINQISLSSTVSIPKGNFDFLIEATHNEQLYLCCLNAEKMMMVDCDNCLLELRRAIETLGIELEKWSRVEIYDLSEKEALRTIYIDLKRAKEQKGNRKERRRISKKNFYIRHVIDFEKKEHEEYTKAEIQGFINDYHAIFPYEFNEPANETTSLERIAHDLYSRCSAPIKNYSEISGEDCKNLVKLFRQLLCLLNYVQEPYDSRLAPMDKYFPVPSEYYAELGFIEGNNAGIYVSEDGSKFYLLKRKDREYMETSDENLNHIRQLELDMLDLTFKRTQNSPGCLYYVKTEVGMPEYRKQVFPFIGRPHVMNQSYIDKIDKKSKREELVRGLIRDVLIMHSMKPALMHKMLTPECIYVCEDRRGLIPYIVRFEDSYELHVKNDYNVCNSVNEYFNSINMQKFVAPEIRNSTVVENYDEKCADIYSLGKLIRYIYERDESMIRDFVELLISKDPQKRPTIEEVGHMFDDEVVSFEATVYENNSVLSEFRLLIFTKYHGFENYVIEDTVSVGRMAGAGSDDIKVDSPIASRSHGKFIKRSNGFTYLDMHSTNGTFINGVLYGAERNGRTDEKQLRVGDILRIDHPEFKKPHRNAVLMFVLNSSHHEMEQKSIALVNGMDIYVGRDYGDIKLKNNKVSKRHARFVMKNDVLYVQDFDSKNGVYLNGMRIEGPTKLHAMDAVRIEDYIFIITEKMIYYYAEQE